MTTNRIKKNALQNEAGVYLPALAVISTSIIAVIFLLTFNTLLLRRASAHFRDVAETICVNTATDPYSHLASSAAEVFSESVNAAFATSQLQAFIDINRFELTRARLVLPVMNEAVDFHYNTSGGTPVFNSVVNPATLGITACSVVSGGCEFQGYAYTTSPRPFPAFVMHQRASAGNTFGCEFEAKVRVFNLFGIFDGMSGDVDGDQVTMRAFYAYHKMINGRFPNYNPSSIAANDAPGLTIAISTHLPTDPSDVRYQFTDANLIDRFSPVNGAGTTPSDFSGLGGNLTTDIAEKTFTAGSLVEWPGLATTTNFSGSYDYSEAYEMAVACMNPVVLVRNTFLSVLLQHASRTGYLRGSTEILHVGTQHRTFDSSSATPAWPASSDAVPRYLNAPVQLVPFGSDLLRPPNGTSYQLPYIFYDTGGGPADWDDDAEVPDATNHPNLPPNNFPADAYRGHAGLSGEYLQGLHPAVSDFGYTFFGRINPWASNTNATKSHEAPGRNHPEWQSFHSILANQLRVCAHFYQNAGVASAINAPQAALYNSNFEPVELFDNGAAFEPVFASGQPDPDQLCPFNGVDPVSLPNVNDTTCGTVSTAQQTRSDRPYSNHSGVDAISLVGMLGSTQSCPIRSEVRDSANNQMLDSDADGVGDVACLKPVEDLRPDYLGLMQYLSGISDAEAVRSPGLFPITSDAIPSSGAPLKPFASGFYTAAANQNTPLLLVTHKAPRSGERDALRNWFESTTAIADMWSQRRIIVVFIPYNNDELSRAGDLATAFRATYDAQADAGGTCTSGTSCNEDRAFRNAVIVFDPTDPDGEGNTAADYCGGDACSETELQAYWNQFASATMATKDASLQDLSVALMAHKVLVENIIRPAERKY